MDILLFPPITFIISLFVIYIFASIFSSFPPKSQPNSEKTKTYACGEDFPSEKVVPNYEEFYPFAIFFTILHVAGLMIATLSSLTVISGLIPVIYILIIAVILLILFIR